MTIYDYDNNSRDCTAEVARAAGALVRTERMHGKGHVVRQMLADVDADIYVMADLSRPTAISTYDAGSAPATIALLAGENLDMAVGARKSELEQAHRRGRRFGNRMW